MQIAICHPRFWGGQTHCLTPVSCYSIRKCDLSSDESLLNTLRNKACQNISHRLYTTFKRIGFKNGSRFSDLEHHALLWKRIVYRRFQQCVQGKIKDSLNPLDYHLCHSWDHYHRSICQCHSWLLSISCHHQHRPFTQTVRPFSCSDCMQSEQVLKNVNNTQLNGQSPLLSEPLYAGFIVETCGTLMQWTRQSCAPWKTLIRQQIRSRFKNLIVH